MPSRAEARELAESAIVSTAPFDNAHCGISLGHALAQRLTRESDREVLLLLQNAHSPRRVRASELHLTAARCAEWLQAKALRPGDLVILLLPPSLELAAAFIGATYAGLIPAILPHLSRQNAKQRLATLTMLIAQSGARAVVCSVEFKEQLSTAVSACNCVLDALDIDTLPSPTRAFVPVQRDENDAAYIQFSSGTTGAPKGAIISNRAIVNQLRALVAAWQIQRSDVTVGWLPWFHDMGLVTQLLLPAAHDGKAVLLASDHWLRQPARLFHCVSAHAGTLMFMPNFGYAHCLRYVTAETLSGVDLGTLRMVTNAGEPVLADTVNRFFERYSRHGLKACAKTTGYGLAENVLGASCTPVDVEPRIEWMLDSDLMSGTTLQAVTSDTPGARAILSCGQPLPGTMIRVVGDGGRPVAERIPGEIEIASDCLFSGYWRRPELTAQVMRAGWLRTGDIGYLAHGEVFVCGRKQDVIIVGGRNIDPIAIESLVMDAGAGAGRIKRAAAFGVTTDLPGTESVVVVFEARRRIADTELSRLCENIRSTVMRALNVPLADVQAAPRGWIKVTSSGKLARAATRETYLAAQAASGNAAVQSKRALTSAPDESVTQWIISLVRPYSSKEGDIHASDNILALGIDSLAFLQLILQVEARFDCTIALDALVDEPTIAKLAQLIEPSAAAAPIQTIPAALPAPVTTSSTLHLLQRRSDWITHGPPLIRSYSLGNKLLRQATDFQLLRARLLRSAARDAQQALTEIGGAPCTEALLRHSFFSNCWRVWRRRMLVESSDKWISVQGLDTVQATLAAGRGIVLAEGSTTTHFALGKVIRELTVPVSVIGLGRAPAANTLSVGSTDYDPRAAAADRESMLAHQLVLAQRVLEQGGVVVAAGDGREGQRRIGCPFLGRERRFSLGFAEIAVLTGAAVIPVWTSLAWDGRVTIHFAAPIDTACADTRDIVVQRFAQWLAAQWRSDPANLPWRLLREFLSLPVLAGVEQRP